MNEFEKEIRRRLADTEMLISSMIKKDSLDSQIWEFLIKRDTYIEVLTCYEEYE